MPASGDAREHRTASRVTAILELASRGADGVRLGDVATELGAPRSSVHGLIKGLVATGYLVESAGSYSLGPAVEALLSSPPPSPRHIRACMERLCTELDETVTLVTLIGQSVVYVDCVETTQPVRYSATLGVRRPLYPTSSGKCFLSFADERFRNSYLRSEFPDDASRDPVELELRQIRSAGVALNRAETLPDLYAVSAPVVDRGAVVRVITAAGPSGRFIPRLGEITESVKAAAESVSS